MQLKLGIIGSTRGTGMLVLQDAIAHGKLDAEIAVVVSNKADALILARAREFQIPANFIDPTELSREEYDNKLTDCLVAHKVDLIVLIGFMRILSSAFIARWRDKIINVHPSLLPAFAGLMDQSVHQAVLASGVKETGCSVHQVTEEVDAGPVLVQKKCIVLPHDTVESLKARVQSLEGPALIEAIQKIGKSQ